jgi:hypothetical protein
MQGSLNRPLARDQRGGTHDRGTRGFSSDGERGSGICISGGGGANPKKKLVYVCRRRVVRSLQRGKYNREIEKRMP